MSPAELRPLLRSGEALVPARAGGRCVAATRKKRGRPVLDSELPNPSINMGALMKPEEIINVTGVEVGCDVRGHLLLIKLADDSQRSHILHMPTKLVREFVERRRRFLFGPYDAPERPEVSPEDWTNPDALEAVRFNAFQKLDELKLTVWAADGRVVVFMLSPPLHAYMSWAFRSYAPDLVDVEEMQTQGLG